MEYGGALVGAYHHPGAAILLTSYRKCMIHRVNTFLFIAAVGTDVVICWHRALREIMLPSFYIGTLVLRKEFDWLLRGYYRRG